VSYGYTNGFLTAVPSYATSISYSVNTMPYQIAHANGVSATYGLDSNRIQRVAGVTTTGASTNNLNLTPFAYDGADNIKSIGSQTFVYDKVSRLTSATIVTGGTSKTQAASYDAFGFILSLNTNGTNQTFTPVSGTNHISGSNYDGAGAVTGWGVYIYTWDQLGKMRTVTGTGVNHTYLYTADGERISDRDSLAATTTLTVRGSDGKVLRIYAKSGSTWSWSKDYVYQQGMLLGSIDASATKYFDLDHLGTPRLITGSGGTTLAFHDYYPFGQEATSATQDTERMKFTGHERDLMGTSAQTDDLDYMHARYDNPNIARFLSPDLLRGDPHQPQSFNLFAYVQNNPMNYVDPLGLQFDLSYNAPKQRETGRVTITYGGFGEGIPIAIPSSIFWMIFGPGVLGGSQAGGSSGGAVYSESASILNYISISDLASWRATKTGALAWVDGLNPLGDPLANAGLYDRNFPGVQASTLIGVATRDIELTIALGCGISRVPGLVGRTSWFSPGGLLNSNRYLRIGWGRFGGERVFRAAGEWVRWISKNGKIDFWNGGPL